MGQVGVILPWMTSPCVSMRYMTYAKRPKLMVEDTRDILGFIGIDSGNASAD